MYFKRLIGKRRNFSSFRDVYGLFVGGKTVIPTNTKLFEVNSPATGALVTKVASASVDDVNAAASIAQEAFQSGIWSKSDVRDRSKVLFKIADNLRQQIPRLAEMEVQQTGRPVKEMKAQLGRLPEWFEYFGSLIRVHEGSVPPFFGPYVNYVKRVPLGVVTQLTPWNHPMLIAIKKIAPALAAGNSILLKPSELAPVSVLELASLIHDSGVPSGVLNVLPGFGPETGHAMCVHPFVRKVDLTGGTNTGRIVSSAAGSNLASVITELGTSSILEYVGLSIQVLDCIGGKAPMIMFEDCDVDQAVDGACFATFVATGQTCIMGARVLLHQSIYKQFLDKLVEKVKRIRLGDPNSMDTQMGPVISHASRERIHVMVCNAKDEGANILLGGNYPTMDPPFDKGSYYSPTVIEVNKQMKIWSDEVFGPVLVAIPFNTEEEAVELANHSPYGLAAAIWTKDVMRSHRVAEKLDVGIIWINDHHRNDPSSPWGGQKDSGVGRENGLDALHEYTQSKSVIVRTDPSKFDWFEQKNARYS